MTKLRTLGKGKGGVTRLFQNLRRQTLMKKAFTVFGSYDNLLVVLMWATSLQKVF